MTHVRTLKHAPAIIKAPGPVVRRLLHLGMPMGPNTIVAMRGRRSGDLLEVPLALVEFGGRRYVVGTFGEVNWVRNLRANPDIEVRLAGQMQPAHAVELGHDAAVAFFRDTLTGYGRAMNVLGRAFMRVFLATAARDIAGDPEGAADRHPVFELVQLSSAVA